jgi:hypothetical protein
VSTLKNILDGLKSEERARLIHAFESHFSQYVTLPGDRFIGVNITHHNFIKETEAGVWSTGTIKRNKQ